jgi:hypothetical protein
VAGAPVRADRAVIEASETDETVAEALAGVDGPATVDAQALLEELAQGGS